MEEGGDLLNHITYMTTLAEQLREIYDKIQSQKFAMVLLGSLPESYENFITSSNARKVEDMDWDNIKLSLIEEHLKRKRRKKIRKKTMHHT